MKKITWILLLTVLFVSCAPDPRSVAEADATRIRAEQDAADQAQARQQSADAWEIEKAQREAEAGQWVESWNNFVQWGMLFATIAVCAFLGAGAVGASWAVIGIGRAAANYAMVRSNLIPLDRYTRQFPLVNYAGHGRFFLSNPNTGGVIALDSRNSADRQMIAASGAVQYGGAIAEAARQHQADPAGVSLIAERPVVVGALETNGNLEVGGFVGSTIQTSFGGNHGD